jgi:hypothetical protein
MSLISEGMRACACELELHIVRAGVTMPPRALTVINELHDWIGDLEESDKRLPCDCHNAEAADDSR